MKKKRFVFGALALFTVVCLAFGLVFGLAYGVGIYSSADLKGYNVAHVFVNGQLVLQKGQDFTDAGGQVLPATLSFKNTTYVPLRKLAEILNLDVKWDGTIQLTDKKVDHGNLDSSGAIEKVQITYSHIMKLGSTPAYYKSAYIEDTSGNVVPGLLIENSMGQLTVSNGYKLKPETTYYLTLVTAKDRIQRQLQISALSLDSFVLLDNSGWVAVVPANPAKGFHHPYMLRIPKKSSNIANDLKAMQNRILAEGSNEFLTYNNDEVVSKNLDLINGWYSSRLGNSGGYVSLLSLFPRPAEDGLLYTHSLDRDTLFGTEAYLNSLGRGNLYRIDKQYDAMIADAINFLNLMGKPMESKVYLIGFSASSDFATRFNFTHPDRARAVVVNSAPTLPLVEYKGFKMNFPLGVADISSMTGSPFDEKKYKSVPQFWHTGDKDSNDGTYFTDGWGNYGNPDLNDNQEGIDYRKLFGDEIIARKALIEKVLNEAGFTNIKHKTYPGVEHGWNEEIVKDAIAFLKAN